MNCPHCSEPCWRQSVDVGVGVIHGPYGCEECGWSEDDTYDCRETWPARKKQDGGWVDPWGSWQRDPSDPEWQEERDPCDVDPVEDEVFAIHGLEPF